MNNENTPQRPDGTGTHFGQGTPRIEVEPTPTEVGAGATSDQGVSSWYAAQAQRSAAPYNESGPSTDPAEGHTVAQPTSAGGVPPTTPPDFNHGAHSAPEGDQGAIATRTVVKTRTKKLPVFLAALGGLVVGAVLVIALVMVGAFRITDTDVQAPAASQQTIDIDPETRRSPRWSRPSACPRWCPSPRRRRTAAASDRA